MPFNNGSGSYLMILSMKQQPRMAFIATVLESTRQWLMTSIPKNNAGFHQYHTVLVLGTFYLCVKHCPWQLRNSQPQTLGAHFLGTHSACYPRFVEETIIAGWVCEGGGCLSYWEQEAEWRHTQGEIRPCRPSPCVPVLPPLHPVMNQGCIQTVLFSICLCACFFGSLLFYQHKCEGTRCEQKMKRWAKASCTVQCPPWDALVKLWVTVIPSESYTRKPSGGRGWASIRHLPRARFCAQCFIISVLLDASMRWFSM